MLTFGQYLYVLNCFNYLDFFLLMLVISVACCFRIFSLFFALLESSVFPPAEMASLAALLVLSLAELETTEARDIPWPAPAPPRLSD